MYVRILSSAILYQGLQHSILEHPSSFFDSTQSCLIFKRRQNEKDRIFLISLTPTLTSSLTWKLNLFTVCTCSNALPCILQIRTTFICWPETKFSKNRRQVLPLLSMCGSYSLILARLQNGHFYKHFTL